MSWRKLDKSHPDYHTMKEMMKEMDLRTLISDGQYGIPKRCPCGGQIFHEISKHEGDLGNRYFTCKVYKNDGLHFRVPWFYAVEEEFQRLRDKLDEQDKMIKTNDQEIAQLKKVVKELMAVFDK